MKVTVITPTCDRPVGIRELERMMVAQTRQPDQWLVCSGGTVHPQVATAVMMPLLDPPAPGPANLVENLLHGLDFASGDVIVFVEDDDWMHQTHIERLVRQFEDAPRTLAAAGDDMQRYYNLPLRLYRTFDNVGASLCQTAIHRAMIPVFKAVAEGCAKRGTYGIDTTFWREILGSYETSLVRTKTVVGLKGLPGQPGLGVGHRPKGSGWLHDPTGQILAEWIGDEDAKHYRELVPAV